GDRLSLRISHLEPEKRRVGFTQRWGTDAAEVSAERDAVDEAVNDALDDEITTHNDASAEVEAAFEEQPESAAGREDDDSAA
ncbi:MAG: hypothetical protein SNJ59_17275, partial [Aggregatilineales bacterium]